MEAVVEAQAIAVPVVSVETETVASDRDAVSPAVVEEPSKMQAREMVVEEGEYDDRVESRFLTSGPGVKEVRFTHLASFKAQLLKLAAAVNHPKVRRVVITSAGKSVGSAIAVYESMKAQDANFADRCEVFYETELVHHQVNGRTADIIKKEDDTVVAQLAGGETTQPEIGDESSRLVAAAVDDDTVVAQLAGETTTTTTQPEIGNESRLNSAAAKRSVLKAVGILRIAVIKPVDYVPSEVTLEAPKSTNNTGARRTRKSAPKPKEEGHTAGVTTTVVAGGGEKRKRAPRRRPAKKPLASGGVEGAEQVVAKPMSQQGSRRNTESQTTATTATTAETQASSEGRRQQSSSSPPATTATAADTTC